MKGDFLTPSSLCELMAALSDGGKTFSLVAGGTDWVAARMKRANPDAVTIDLSGVRELKYRSVAGDSAELGAMSTMSEVADDAHLRRFASCLCEAASKVGSWQIRNRATLGGNLANASPAADTPVTLAALGAAVKIASPRGNRDTSIEKISCKANENTLAADEVILGFSIPLKERRISSFAKVGSRSEVSIARLNLAVSVDISDDSRKAAEGARVYAGTLGRSARRCDLAENVLREEGLQGERGFCDALTTAVENAIPGRSTLSYKKSVITAIGMDILSDLRKKAEALP